jgi:hypothetical protein
LYALLICQKLLLLAPSVGIEEILEDTEGMIVLGDAGLPVPPIKEKSLQKALKVGSLRFAIDLVSTLV